MKSIILRLMLAALSFLPLAASAVYVYNTINYPGAVSTDTRGITNTGRIVGYASLDGVNFFSFSYEAGVYTPLPAPVVPLTASALAINDTGVIVGAAFDAAFVAQGFIYNAGTYAFFSRLGWPNTYARMISNSGIITGYSDDPATSTSAGFIYDPFTSVFTDITIPYSFLTIAQGINAAGQVVGSAVLIGDPLHADGTWAFLRQPGLTGAIEMFRIGTAPTRARGINDVGLITGFMTVAGVNQGFVATSSGFQTLMVPGSDATFPEGINNAGQVVGLYTTTGGTVTRGFIATPATMPTGTTSGGAFTFSVAVIPNFPIFIDPPVSVGFDYAIGKGNPKFATLRLPIGIGDSLYRVKAQGKKFRLAGGVLLDFRAHGFPKGVSDFTVKCIEVDAALDPANPEAFPTEVTFMAAGMFTGTMKPIVRNSNKGDKRNCKPKHPGRGTGLDDDDDEDEDEDEDD